MKTLRFIPSHYAEHEPDDSFIFSVHVFPPGLDPSSVSDCPCRHAGCSGACRSESQNRGGGRAQGERIKPTARGYPRSPAFCSTSPGGKANVSRDNARAVRSHLAVVAGAISSTSLLYMEVILSPFLQLFSDEGSRSSLLIIQGWLLPVVHL